MELGGKLFAHGVALDASPDKFGGLRETGLKNPTMTAKKQSGAALLRGDSASRGFARWSVTVPRKNCTPFGVDSSRSPSHLNIIGYVDPNLADAS
jgi:hypothetical protein